MNLRVRHQIILLWLWRRMFRRLLKIINRLLIIQDLIAKWVNQLLSIFSYRYPKWRLNCHMSSKNRLKVVWASSTNLKLSSRVSYKYKNSNRNLRINWSQVLTIKVIKKVIFWEFHKTKILLAAVGSREAKMLLILATVKI